MARLSAAPRCSKCGEEDPTRFYSYSPTRCKACVVATSREWKEAHPDRYREIHSDAYRRRRQSGRYAADLARLRERSRVRRIAAATPCEHCGAAYEPAKGGQRFCSDRCRSDFSEAKRKAAVCAQVEATRFVCAGCGEEFRPAPGEHRRVYCSFMCRESYRQRQPRWSPTGLFVKHGCTKEERARLFAEQRGRCAICRVQGKPLVVDHDHATGVVRGLVCSSCNAVMGYARDNPAVLRAAAAFVRGKSA